MQTDDPRVPVQLLVYSVQTAVTTATCIADYMSWSEFLTAQKMELGKLYVPYLALGMFSFVVLVFGLPLLSIGSNECVLIVPFPCSCLHGGGYARQAEQCRWPSSC